VNQLINDNDIREGLD